MYIEKITGTYTRTTDMMKKYHTVMSERAAARKNNTFSIYPYTETILKEFKYWKIVPNDFPYDAIADINHMIFPKRDFKFDWSLMNNEERDELDYLKNKGYIAEHYDVVYENLPSGQTMPGRFHLHLLKLKRYDLDL